MNNDQEQQVRLRPPEILFGPALTIPEEWSLHPTDKDSVRWVADKLVSMPKEAQESAFVFFALDFLCRIFEETSIRPGKEWEMILEARWVALQKAKQDTKIRWIEMLPPAFSPRREDEDAELGPKRWLQLTQWPKN